MLKKAGKVFLLAGVSVTLLTGCSRYNKMLKSTNMDAKLDYALQLYEKKQYFKALPLFEELVTMNRGTKKAEKTYYYYSYTNYYLGDYETAAFDFENFARSYPTSEFAEECAFMHAYCYYQDSPLYSLDQTSTVKAMNELQLFADRYPRSSKQEECNALIDKLRAKLEIKAYENASLYFRMDEFKAAVTSYKNILRDYPSGQYREECSFYIIKAWYGLAENSYEDKKVDRYNESLRSYNEFITNFPESKFRKNADDLAAQSRKKLDKLASEEISLKN